MPASASQTRWPAFIDLALRVNPAQFGGAADAIAGLGPASWPSRCWSRCSRSCSWPWAGCRGARAATSSSGTASSRARRTPSTSPTGTPSRTSSMASDSTWPFGLLDRAWPLLLRLTLATTLAAAWEIFENTDFVIDHYRAATVALGYRGDSVVNSVGDVARLRPGLRAGRAAAGPARRLPSRQPSGSWPVGWQAPIPPCVPMLTGPVRTPSRSRPLDAWRAFRPSSAGTDAGRRSAAGVAASRSEREPDQSDEPRAIAPSPVTLGVSETAVRKAEKSGRIRRAGYGSWNVEKVKAAWRGNTDPVQRRARAEGPAAGARAAVRAAKQTLHEQGLPAAGGMTFRHLLRAVRRPVRGRSGDRGGVDQGGSGRARGRCWRW